MIERNAVKCTEIENRVQRMMEYVYSEKGKRLNRPLAQGIAYAILKGHTVSETAEYVDRSQNTVYKYLNPTYREDVRKDNADYKRKKRREDPEFVKREESRQKRYPDRVKRENACRSSHWKISQDGPRLFSDAEKIEEMIYCVHSPEGARLDKELAQKIAEGILNANGKSFNEISLGLAIPSKTFYNYIDPEYLRKVKSRGENHQKTRRATDPEYKELMNSYQWSCPMACLLREEEVHDNSPLSDFVSEEELQRRKKDLEIPGSLPIALRYGEHQGYIVKVFDQGTNKYAINFSSKFFDDLTE